MATKWRRLVLDECHDAVLLGGFIMERLLAIQARNVWCVTGTPFPRGDDSVWGINQVGAAAAWAMYLNACMWYGISRSILPTTTP